MQLIQKELEIKEITLHGFAGELNDLLSNYFFDQTEQNQIALSEKTVQIIDLEYEINELESELKNSITL